MARKTSKTPIIDPPTASSSESSEGEEEEEEKVIQYPKTQENSKKSMDETSKTKKSRSKPLLSSTKRPSISEEEPKESKRSKTGEKEPGSVDVVAEEVKNTGEYQKKQLFQRLFSDDDEIAVLKGSLDYLTGKGVDPFADKTAFYDFVKDSIQTDVSKQQLMFKVRRLRKKFENNVRRSKQGEGRTFTNPHEQKIFELSKKIWGEEGINEKLGNGKEFDTLKAKEEDVGEPIEDEMECSKSLGTLFDMKSGVGSLENEILKHGFDMIGEEKRAAFEEKWRKLQAAELELFLQRNELIMEQAKLMLESYKSEYA